MRYLDFPTSESPHPLTSLAHSLTIRVPLRWHRLLGLGGSNPLGPTKALEDKINPIGQRFKKQVFHQKIRLGTIQLGN